MAAAGGGGGMKLLWRPLAALAQAACSVTGGQRAASVRAEDLAERLRARKSERQQQQRAMLGGAAAPPLRLCHRLDKETTGAMVLARGAEAAARLRQLFQTRQVHKVYWAIAVGQPEPPEGLVDIPVVERAVRGGQAHFKRTLAPNYRLEGDREVKTRRARGAACAVTRYRVLAAASGCSLLELQPVTGVKHQLRVHLAYGLGCPVLGDHKYSHWRKLAPQKLPEAALTRLRLRQAQARHVPLHLHARCLALPRRPGAEPLQLRCPPPAFFLSTMRRLRLEPADPGA
ncbi:mitochondrial RNA pseudouridine synthase RPUSD4 [Nothoprocta perdicaria]|uniref:mitochondrial RNA pseudouridine synthase RPUSD4 n=1 Tax=Nothoprocta perdicaria TaxID=30464 RepID=UPI000E1C17C1|nr:mitochondrial RNA pseudouridine synthase RPUSD4 [Nothoprocta perdicaria]